MRFATSHSLGKNSLAPLFIVLITLIGYGMAVADWPQQGKLLDRRVLNVGQDGTISIHKHNPREWWVVNHPFGQWRIAFNTPTPEGRDKTTVYAYPPCLITDASGRKIEGGTGRPTEIVLRKIPEDERLGMDDVTHYVDVGFKADPSRHWQTAVIALFGDAPLHVAYILREPLYNKSHEKDNFFYVNTDICPGGSEALFRAFKKYL